MLLWPLQAFGWIDGTIKKGLKWLVISWTLQFNPTSENLTLHSILPSCGEILQVKWEPLESDREAPLSYTLIWCSVEHNPMTPSSPRHCESHSLVNSDIFLVPPGYI